MKVKPQQESFDFTHRETLIFSHPLHYLYEKTALGVLSQLALEPGNWVFNAAHIREQLYNVTHESGVSFLAELKPGKGKNKGTYSIKGCVKDIAENKSSFFDGINIQKAGANDWKLRPAQLGAVYSLLVDPLPKN